jgi:pimeloyl-ACP methyl ester carboxylesterase
MNRLAAALALLLWSMSSSLAAPADVGVVYMHGKWGSPDWDGVTVLTRALVDRGYVVENIEMPWSRKRDYDKDYTEALAEIDAAVARLRAKGASRIVVAGHSFGANAALAYGATRDGMGGVMMLAPGHSPDLQRGLFADGVAKAQSMIADGRAESMGRFDDNNQGQTKQVDMRARVYLSYFDPQGLGAMSVNAPKLKSGAALMVLIGDKDPWFRRVKSLIFDAAPADPRSRYVEISSNHKDTPRDGLGQVLEWLQGFE